VLVVVGADSSCSTVERVLDRALGARTIERLPGPGDELGQPPTLLRAGRKAAARGGSPDPARHRAEDLVPPNDREPELVQGLPKAFEEQCPSRFVVA